MKLRLSSAGSPALKRDPSMKPKFGGGTSLRVACLNLEGRWGSGSNRVVGRFELLMKVFVVVVAVVVVFGCCCCCSGSGVG
jgi:hypothetical protein